MRAGLLLASIAFLATAAAATESALSIKRSVFVEKPAEDGVSLEPASRLRTGDKVVLVMQWDGQVETRSFTLASEVPAPLAFQRTSRDGVEVSVDGGRSWGRLGALMVGQRAAAPEDVTHLRWRVAANEAPGMFSYSAIVR